MHLLQSRPGIAWAAVAILYAALSLGSARSRQPRQDEGYFASAAHTLLTRGYLGTAVMETAGTDYPGIDRRTYWVMPLHLLAQAGWYKLFGFGLFPMRSLSVAFGVIALVALGLLLRRLSGDPRVAWLGVLLTASSYDFVMISADGRMDVMCAALSLAGLAAYLEYRERSLAAALLGSHALVAASLLTHPNGAMGLAGLCFLMLRFDRKQLRFAHLPLVALPYLIGAAGWGWYILQDPTTFAAQFSANARDMGRLSLLTSPWAALKMEITGRYLGSFGGFSDRVSALAQAKSLGLLLYAAAAVGCVAIPAIRRQPGTRVLLALTAIYFLGLTVLDGQKQYIYVIHIVPFFSALAALWLVWCGTGGPARRSMTALAVLGFLGLQMAGVGYRIAQNTYAKTYVPAVQYLLSQWRDGMLVMGSAELGFGIGFDGLLDDPRIGALTGKRPDFIAVSRRWQIYFDDYAARGSDGGFVARRLAGEYRMVFDSGSYRIYARR